MSEQGQYIPNRTTGTETAIFESICRTFNISWNSPNNKLQNSETDYVQIDSYV